MLKKLNKYVQQKIQVNYNKIINKTKSSHEDAAFITFLDCVHNIAMFIFFVFSAISLFLFTKMEIIPFIIKLIS